MMKFLFASFPLFLIILETTAAAASFAGVEEHGGEGHPQNLPNDQDETSKCGFLNLGRLDMICKNGQEHEHEHDSDCIEVCSLFSFWNTYRCDGVFQRELRGFSKGGSVQATSAPTSSPTAAPTSAPTSAPSTVFVTSSRHDGNLGGIQGADELCQNLADQNGLPAGIYLAWLSNSTTSPSDRFVKSNGPYVLKNGTLIANNYDDLTDGTIDFPIVLDENGVEQPPSHMAYPYDASRVWTTTEADGTATSNYNCNEWNSSEVRGAAGSLVDVNWKWSHAITNGCGNSHRLYCFQQ